MSFFLSPIGNDQQIDANGDPLIGGQIETYLAGSSTPAATLTSSTGAIAQSNPIILNALGAPDSPIWISGGIAYKFVIKSAAGVTLRTIDNISGINDSTLSVTEWISSGFIATYISPTSFSVAGDQTLILSVSRRLKTENTGGTAYSTISASVFSTGVTTVTVVNDLTPLDSGLSSVSYSLIQNSATTVGASLVAASSKQAARQLIGLPGTGQLAGLRNLVINGNFNINQIGYVSGTATVAANQYTLDRWRVVTSGQSLTFSASGNGNQITAPAGGIEQVIEGANIGGGTYVVNWSGTGTCSVNGTARAKGETFALTANTNATVKLVGQISKFQLEPGEIVTPFEERPKGLELQLCKRHLEVGSSVHEGYGTTGVGDSHSERFAVEKYAVPTITYSPTSAINVSTNDIREATAGGFTVFCVPTATGGFVFKTTWVARAEIP